MNERKHIQDSHEACVLSEFIKWFNGQNGTNYEIVSKPEPPDALAKDGDKTVWLEHTDVYRSKEEARDELTFVSKDEEHQPHSGIIKNPDQKIAERFVEGMIKKLNKDSYCEIFKTYGKGYLILSERDPLFSESSLEAIKVCVEDSEFNDKGYFDSVFIAYRNNSGLIFEKILY